jgi:hypothetical protein
LYIYWAIVVQTKMIAASVRMECKKKLSPDSSCFLYQNNSTFRFFAWIMAIIGADDRKPAPVLIYPAHDQEIGYEIVAGKLEAVLRQDPQEPVQHFHASLKVETHLLPWQPVIDRYVRQDGMGRHPTLQSPEPVPGMI